MISFIVIGKNEGWKLSTCLQSILKAVEHSKHTDFEIIYVDSKSTDDSIERAKKFPGVKVFRITGPCNAAIARNSGANEARGDILFFIDGDMEIDESFLSRVIRNNELIHDCVTGHLDDYFYNKQGEFLTKQARTYTSNLPEKEQRIKSNGGIFLVKRSVWEQLKGMRTKYKVNEDIDLSLRIHLGGFEIFRMPYLITKHHTIEYLNENRMFLMLKNLHVMYSAILFRDFFFKKVVWQRSVRSQYTAFLLIISIILLAIGQMAALISFTIYIMATSFRVLVNTKRSHTIQNKGKYIFKRFAFQICNDFMFNIGFLFFYPKNQKPKYAKVN